MMKAEKIHKIRIPELSGGINVRDADYAINDNQSPDLLNVWYRNKTLSKRPGQKVRIARDDIIKVSEKMYGVHDEPRIMHAGNKFYRLYDGYAHEMTGEYSLTTTPGTFIMVGTKIYYFTEVVIWVIAYEYVNPDLDYQFTVKKLTAYEPVVKINCAPDMSSGDDNEPYNRIGWGFTAKYNGDGSSTLYKLVLGQIESTAVKVSINGVNKTEGVHFTVNRTEGTVNFAAGTSPHGAPSTGTNNVWITAYDGYVFDPLPVTRCKTAVLFGGQSAGPFSGTRVIMTASTQPGYKNAFFYSDVITGAGISYFPDTSVEYMDEDGGRITTAGKMGDELILFKENSIYAMRYSYDGENVYFPPRRVHSEIGCDISGSVQLIDNKIVFGNTKDGLFMLISTDNKLETIIKPLSGNINHLLLAENDLKTAASVDYGRCYWLKAGDHVYVWDYDKTPYRQYTNYDEAQRGLAWYVFDNINAKQFFYSTSLFYYNDEGIVEFIDDLNDFGEPINAYFKSKIYDIKSPHVLKTFRDMFISFKSGVDIDVLISVGSEKANPYREREYQIAVSGEFADVRKFKLNMSRSSFVQISVESNKLNKGVGIDGFVLTYQPSTEVRKR